VWGDDFQVSALGLGCMGLSAYYGAPVEDKDGVAVIHHAFNNGVTFFDTSDAYGPFTNEKLLGLVQYLLKNFLASTPSIRKCIVLLSKSNCSPTENGERLQLSNSQPEANRDQQRYNCMG